jgi:hypothetical protein
VHNSRHIGSWIGAWVFAALAAAELLLVAGSGLAALNRNGPDWQHNHAEHVAAAQGALLMIGCVAGGALLALLLTLLPRSSQVSAAGRALAISAGAFLGGLALLAYGVVWAFTHMRLVF